MSARALTGPTSGKIVGCCAHSVAGHRVQRDRSCVGPAGHVEDGQVVQADAGRAESRCPIVEGTQELARDGPVTYTVVQVQRARARTSATGVCGSCEGTQICVPL